MCSSQNMFSVIRSNFKYFLAFFFLLSFLSQAEEYEKVSVEVKAEKFGQNSYYIPGRSGAATEYEGFISNAGFVVTEEGVIVFDALGTPSLANAMLQEIKKVTDKPIKLLISSHYHADHIYGLQVFKNEGAEIWAPKGVYNYLDSENSKNLLEARRTALFPWVNEDTYLVKPDRIIEQDETFEMGGQEFLISFFGSVHSDGDLALVNKSDEVLYIGDVIFAGRVPFVGNADIKKWISTLDRMMKVKTKYLVPGHGGASEDAKETMVLTYEYLNFLIDQFTPVVEDMGEFDTAYQKIDWSKYENLPAFEEANRRNAYSAFLYLERTLQ